MQALETEHPREAIEQLPERAKYVLVRRYGLDDSDPVTVADLSRKLGLSKDRVRELLRNTERLFRAGGFGTGDFGAEGVSGLSSQGSMRVTTPQRRRPVSCAFLRNV